jgi:hypothetical protein
MSWCHEYCRITQVKVEDEEEEEEEEEEEHTLVACNAGL